MREEISKNVKGATREGTVL